MILRQLIIIPKVIALLVFVLAVGAFYLGFGNQDVQMAKPKNVPHSAQWVGGQDGGDWIRCKESTNSKRVECSMFSELTGELTETATFTRQNFNEPISTVEFDFYDGDKIVTTNGEILLKDKSDWQ